MAMRWMKQKVRGQDRDASPVIHAHSRPCSQPNDFIAALCRHAIWLADCFFRIFSGGFRRRRIPLSSLALNQPVNIMHLPPLLIHCDPLNSEKKPLDRMKDKPHRLPSAPHQKQEGSDAPTCSHRRIRCNPG